MLTSAVSITGPGFLATKCRSIPSLGWIWMTIRLGGSLAASELRNSAAAIGLNWTTISVSRAAIALPVRR